MATKTKTLTDYVAQSLAVYAERGEYDGSLESAKECLELAGYEWPAVETVVRALVKTTDKR